MREHLTVACYIASINYEIANLLAMHELGLSLSTEIAQIRANRFMQKYVC